MSVKSFIANNFPFLLNILFEDLRQLHRIVPELWDLMYCERDQEERALYSNLLDSRARTFGKNTLVVGDPKVGKSSFIYNFIKKYRANLEKDGIYIIPIDFYELGRELKKDANIAAWIRELLIVRLLKFYQKMEYSLPGELLTKTNETSSANQLQELVRYLDLIFKKKGKIDFQPVIFIDDIDAVLADHHDLILGCLIPLLNSPFCQVIYAVRPPGLRAIDDSKDDAIKAAFIDMKPIVIQPLSIETVLAKRMAPILNASGSLSDKISFIRKNAQSFWEFIKSSLKTDADYSKMEDGIFFPFSDVQIDFIQSITNGNLTDAIRIAKTYFEYIWSKNKNYVLESGPSVLSMDTFIQDRVSLLHALNTENSFFKLIDLGELKSKGKNSSCKGNWLILNILEAIAIYQFANNPEFFNLLKGLGHTHEEVKRGLTFCENNYLIEPYTIKNAMPRLLEHTKYNDSDKFAPYQLTFKGSFYLRELSNWDEYKIIYGTSKHSLFELRYPVSDLAFEKSVLTMLFDLVNVASSSIRKILINIHKLYELYIKYYGSDFAKSVYCRGEFGTIDQRIKRAVSFSSFLESIKAQKTIVDFYRHSEKKIRFKVLPIRKMTKTTYIRPFEERGQITSKELHDWYIENVEEIND